uniref:Uncharacterized protein n=1 Tax=Rhizophora mucronata TaxID=61149 RepID=A0A2P2R4Z9_RHIMU
MKPSLLFMLMRFHSYLQGLIHTN